MARIFFCLKKRLARVPSNSICPIFLGNVLVKNSPVTIYFLKLFLGLPLLVMAVQCKHCP